MKYIIQTATLLSLLSTFSPSAIADPPGDSLLAVPLRLQERENWCWNACTQMIAFFNAKYYDTQCEIAEKVRVRDGGSWGTTNCCLNPDVGCNHTGGMGTEFNSLGVGTSYVDGILTFAQAQAEIDGHRPFATYINNASHDNVVFGYFTSPGIPYLAVHDPSPYLGTYGAGYDWYTTVWNATVKTTGTTGDHVILYAGTGFGIPMSGVTTGNTVLPFLNNAVSSMKVYGFPYIMYDGENYTGTAWGVTPKDYSSYTKWYGTDNTISSARPVANSTLAQPLMVVLFDGQNFQGDSIVLSNTYIRDLTTLGWNDRVSSMVVVGGLAQVYQHASAGGLAYAVTSEGGPHLDGFYPNPSSWGGPDNDITSIQFFSDAMSASSTTSPVVIYQGENFTGRGLLINWTGEVDGYYPMAWAGYLGNQLMDDNVQSVRTYAGSWCFYADPYQYGNSTCIGANAYRKTSGEIGLTGISSLAFFAPAWSF